MKFQTLLIIVFIIAASCNRSGKEITEVYQAQDTLSYQYKKIYRFAVKNNDTTYISISYPEISEKSVFADSVKNNIEKLITSNDKRILSLEAYADSFIKS